jgi:hypothetical protein
LKGLPTEGEALESDLLKLRAVLILLQALHGAKVQRALLLVRELQAAGVHAALRTLYNWRRSYLIYGFAGLVKHARSDRGRPRQFGQDVLVRISEVAIRIQHRGDLRREYSAFRDCMSFTTFTYWIKWARARVVEFPRGEARGK